jgi:hypothetical protein
MEWLRRPLVCEGREVAEPLEPALLTDEDLWDICLRMHVILDTIEMPRCEGRLIPEALFHAIDDLESLVHGHPSSSAPRLAEWESVICEFGQYYVLAGEGPIIVDPAIYRENCARFWKVPPGTLIAARRLKAPEPDTA